jgi:hypothetical protein
MFRRAIMVLAVLLLFAWVTSSVDAAKDEPKLYTTNNVLAAGNYNQGTSSSDITLIVRIDAGGEIVVDEGHEVKYIVPQEDAEGWTEMEFDDSDWQDGISGVGYGDGDDNTEVVRGQVASIYTRYYFDVPNASNLDEIAFYVDYDDAYILWLNGVEIIRTANVAVLSPVGEVPNWDVSAVRGTMGGHGSAEMPKGQPNDARWKAGKIVTTIVGVEFGGQSGFPVEPQGKLTTTWGHLKALP